MTLEVRQVIHRRDREAALRLPWRIYANDPLWAPPLLFERREFIDPRRHPFYLHGAAALFAAWQGQECVGRVLVSDDPRYNAEQQTNLGCFGMFEAVDDQAVAGALLAAAARWLKARGRNRMRGPIDYSMNYSCGLLVEGFDTPPRVMMNHNPPYYRRLLESAGLAKAKDLYTWWFDCHHAGLPAWRERAGRLALRAGVTIRHFRTRDLKNEVMRCKGVYNEAWRKNWGFVSMTDAEFMHLAKSMSHWAVPEMLLLAEAKGEVVGFSMTLPDLNEALRPLNGRLFRFGVPVGLLQLSRGLRKIRTGRLVTLGVLEGYRRRGIAESMILQTIEYSEAKLGYDGAELGWTLEDNDLINRTIETVGGRLYKRYRIFERDI